MPTNRLAGTNNPSRKPVATAVIFLEPSLQPPFPIVSEVLLTEGQRLGLNVSFRRGTQGLKIAESWGNVESVQRTRSSLQGPGSASLILSVICHTLYCDPVSSTVSVMYHTLHVWPHVIHGRCQGEPGFGGEVLIQRQRDRVSCNHGPAQ